MMSIRVIISGDVQGVGFRTFISRHAKKSGIFGWVKNRQDETVEALFQGEEKKVELMIQLCKQGPETAWVENVDIFPTDSKEFTDFKILS
jgi:acylphosphatase